ncbi:uncharacterized protein LOC122248720 [Penaeus japonicus]|uniref:uncharacterized protein LOC122248720 n=1 Tax=Penaeus japonicus TaxID=27405 RepID=UPI001C714EFC|nr:uncharacterized protein LOC122248720 [Penaeus japonicus]
MALVQNKGSCEVTGPSSEVKCCHCGGSRSAWDVFLPISHRGSFFQDAFFSNIQQHFDAAVREVLDRWGGPDLKPTPGAEGANGDVIGRYRRLRSIDPKEENQAVTVTADNTSHKVVLDVHEFLGGDVRVKAVGERELAVEGRVDRKEEGSSCVTSHTFRRHFCLPSHTDMAAITSVMSSDGILTITVPKLENEDQQKTTIIPIKIEDTQSSQASASVTSGPQSTGKQEVKCEHCSRDIASKQESACNKAVESFPGHNFLPIVRRGLFFGDSFFQESWNDFQRAVKEVLNKWGEHPSAGDDLTRYRSLRSRDLREENQAVTSSEDERQHKFVLDVKDFTDGGEISVKAVNDRELVVEGRKEKEGDGSKCSQRFLRRFVVPGDIRLDGVTSVMSSDGVLTISAPKKQPKLQVKEVPVPISIEGKKVDSPAAFAKNEGLKSNDSSAANSSTQDSGESPTSNRALGSSQKSDSKQNATAAPVSVQRAGESSGQQTSSPSKTSTGVPAEDASAKSSSFAARGRGSDADEGIEEDKDLYKLKGNGAKFPIKINGSVINSNST